MLNILNKTVPGVLAALLLWYGIFFLKRRQGAYKNRSLVWWYDPMVMFGFAMVLISWQVFGVAVRNQVGTTAQYVNIVKITWWTTLPALFFFSYGVFLICQDYDQARILKPRGFIAVVVVAVLTLVLTLVSVFTDAIFAFSNAYPLLSAGSNKFFVPTGPWIILIMAFEFLLSWGSVVLVFRRLKSQSVPDQQWNYLHKLLLVTVLVSFAILLINFSGYFFNLAVPEQVGDFLLLLGVLGFSNNFLQYDSFQKDHIARIDFNRSFFAIVITITAYYVFGLVYSLLFADDSYLAISFLVYFAVMFQTPFNIGATFLDRFLPMNRLTEWELEYLELSEEIRFDVLTAPDPDVSLALSEQKIAALIQNVRKDELYRLILTEVETIFRHKSFENDRLLSESKLFELSLVQEAFQKYLQESNQEVQSLSYSDRAEVLRSFLIRKVERLCPNPGEQPPNLPTQEWIEYLILKEKYVGAKSRIEVEALIRQLGIWTSGGAYSRYLEAARSDLALKIFQRECERRFY